MSDTPPLRSSLQRSSPAASLRPAVKRKQRFSRKKKILVIGIVVLLAAGSIIWWMYGRNQDLNDVDVVKAKVARHYALPTNEMPALATVTDSAKVQANFSVKLQNDDKVLIYENNKKAIVYRPSLDRVVDVEPVTVSNPTSGSTGSSESPIPDINPFGN